MLCPRCGRENREGAKFCGKCRASLVPELACPACGHSNQPDQDFCDECGHSLVEASAPSLPSPGLASPSPHPTSFVSGRYKVKRFLGEGGKKQVYLAHDTSLDRDVAFALIKTLGLDDAARERITREARAMARLSDHPHIMPIYELGQHQGQPYMVLPLMGGGDVEGLIKKAPNQRIPLARALQIAQQVCQGLQFAHDRGFVHRDLKPGNVWLTADGTAKIGDFGLALPPGRPPADGGGDDGGDAYISIRP